MKSGSALFLFPHRSLVSATVFNQQLEESFLLTFKIKDWLAHSKLVVKIEHLEDAVLLPHPPGGWKALLPSAFA